MQIGELKAYAGEWAQTFVQSEAEFYKMFNAAANSGKFSAAEINLILLLAQAYENYLTGLISRDDAVKLQKSVFRDMDEITERLQCTK